MNNISKRVYAALKQEFPDQSNNHIAHVCGVGHSGVSKLAKGYGLGLSAAQWLADNHEGYEQLNEDVKANAEKVHQAAQKKRKATKESKRKRNNLSSFPPHIQVMIGYVP
jgi:DNA-directed RNA polymerase